VKTVMLGVLGVACAGCNLGAPPISGRGIPPERVADMVHAVIEADRKMYASHVVDRLVGEQKVSLVNPADGRAAPLGASEDWRNEYGALPLPAQMLRLGAEQVTKKDVGMTYVLLSPWPINKQNRPRTPVEMEALKALHDEPQKPVYQTEELDGHRFLTAAYADVAVVEACVRCHNAHVDSPKRDFRVGALMGAVVVRIPLD
jgi:hypothetical protein